MRKSRDPVNTPDGVLVRIKDKICVALGIDAYRLKMLIDRFTIRAFNGVENAKVHFDKINTYQEFTKDRMTIKVLFKFFRVIGLKKVKFSVTVTTARDFEITVTEEVYLSAIDNKEPSDGEKDL